MRRCTRDHDLVARIGGDEFAVVFWDKEGPRQPHATPVTGGGIPGRPPQSPEQIFQRFKNLLSGDEFAVVFWEKEGPRQPKDAKPSAMPTKPPQTPQQILERFRRLMATQDFPGLGATGKGVLTISGGLASFPWEGRDIAELIEAADQALVKGAKQGGKDRIFLVGDIQERRERAPE